MKYLKPHPINESIDNDLKYDIEDILLDLNDKGILTSVDYDVGSRWKAYDNHLYTIKIYKNGNDTWIDWSDIEQEVDRLIHFFEENGYNDMSMTIDGDRGEGISFKNRIKSLSKLSEYYFDILNLKFSRTD